MEIKRLIIFSIFLVIGICLFLGGCISNGKWWSLISFIPACLAGICAYFFDNSDPDDTSAIVTYDGWLFAMLVCTISSAALPVLFYIIHYIKALNLGLTLGGCLFFAIGFIVFSRTEEDSIQAW